MILNSYTEGFVHDHEVSGCEINFLSECGYGEEVSVRTGEQMKGSFLHSVMRRKDETEVCRLTLRWRDRADQ